MARNKRESPLELERDVDLMLALRLEGVLTQRQIYAEVNRVREDVAYRRARALGNSEQEAKAAGKLARISDQQFRTDYRNAIARIKDETDTKGRLLVIRRLTELETESAGIRAMEDRAWDELNRSGGGEKPPQQAADPRWMERIESLLWKRYQIGFEIHRLRTLLGMEIPWEMVRLAQSGAPDAAEKLRAHEIGLLYSLEARAAGITAAGETRTRLQMISAFLEKRGGEGGKGGSTTVQFEVIGLEVDGGGTS